MGGHGRDVFPGNTELARRAAGGDGAAFVHLYDRYSAGVFETVLTASASVDTASAATQRAFLKLLSRPPAFGAPDEEIAERLRALAIDAGVEGEARTRSATTGAASGARVGWLRSETIAKAGERFDEDWSVHLDRQPAQAPAPPSERNPALPPVPMIGLLDERPLSAPAPPRRRRPVLAVIEDLPLVAAGVIVLLLAAITLGAAIVRTTSEDPGGATETAVAADESQKPAPADKKLDVRAERRTRYADRRLARGSTDSGDAQSTAARRGPVRYAPRKRASQRVAGRRRSSAPAPRRRDAETPRGKAVSHHRAR